MNGEREVSSHDLATSQKRPRLSAAVPGVEGRPLCLPRRSVGAGGPQAGWGY